MKLWLLIRIFVALTEWTLNKNPDTFLCKFYDFIILILTNNDSQKTHVGEREEKALVRHVFSVSFVSFHIMFPLFLCVSALHSSSVFSLLIFLSLVFDIFLRTSYSLFILLLSALKSIAPAPVHLYLLELYRPRCLVKHQDTALVPGIVLPPHK